MQITLDKIMEEKTKIFEQIASSGFTDDEQKELNAKLGGLLKEHGRHLIGYCESTGTMDADKIGEFFIKWGEYLIRVTKVVPYTPRITNPAKLVSVEHLKQREEWRRLYGNFLTP